MARLKFVTLPEPATPVTIEIDDENLWLRAADRANWRDRANAFDDLLIDSAAVAIVRDQDTQGVTGFALMCLTAAIEHVCDVEIRGPDAAVYYLLTVHAEWRAAARAFFEKNRLDPQAALRNRPGARLVHAVALARRCVPTATAGVH